MVGRRTKIKNHIHDLLVREGQILPRGSRCWTKLGQEWLSSMARPLAEVEAAELWEELQQREMVQARIATVEEKLNAIGTVDQRVQLLRTIPGVVPRLSEAIVALLDQPQRFRKASQVSSYIGMVPKAFCLGRKRPARAHHEARQGTGTFLISRDGVGRARS